MASKSKWIEIASPDEAATHVARRALKARLELVWELLPPAAREADEDIEHVHELRVATRRASAALEIFAGLLPQRRLDWFRHKLKRVRQAAGDARDLDIFNLRLAKLCQRDTKGEACGDLLQRARAARSKAQRPICRVHQKLGAKGYKRRIQGLVSRARPRLASGCTFSCFARTNLRPVIENFYQASAADQADTAALHHFRIAAKRLRYSIEVFSGAFDTALRESIYPQVEKLQEELGEVNDRVLARARLQEWIDDCDDAALAALLRDMLAEQGVGLAQSTLRFVEYWTPQRSAEIRAGLEQAISSPEG